MHAIATIPAGTARVTVLTRHRALEDGDAYSVPFIAEVRTGWLGWRYLGALGFWHVEDVEGFIRKLRPRKVNVLVSPHEAAIAERLMHAGKS